ncbi:MAG: LysM peptidoglycan-binding domain-containing protein [Endomicrobiales bacterium]
MNKKTFSFLRAALFLLLALCAPVRAEVLQEITVKEGDTLWGVANYYLKDPRRWPDILKYNRLPSSDSNVILPGMKLRVPILLIKEHLRSAHLIDLLNDVRYRRRTEAEWKKAQVDMELYNDDGLRTLQQSRAKVKFPSGELLQMDENSLIILKPEKKQEEIDLLSGGVRASRTKILTSSSVVDPRIDPRGPAPDFRTKLKEDKTTLVEVYEGVVDVTAQGKTVTLTGGFGTEVKFQEAPSLPKALPPRPELDPGSPSLVPGTDFTTSGKVTSGALRLDVKAPVDTAAPPHKSAGRNEKAADDTRARAKVLTQMVSKYRVQVSTSHSFGILLIDEVKPITDGINIDFKQSRLPDGVYYYRVAYMDELGFEGQFSAPVQFTIDTTPPVIRVASPQDGEEVDAEFVHVEGTSEPNSIIRINDKTIPVDEKGGFQTAVMPRNGRNIITFVAEDRAGNSSRTELTVEKVKEARHKKAEKMTAAAMTEDAHRSKGLTLASFALGTLTAIVIVGVLVLILQ